jgi:hypothetical protein
MLIGRRREARSKHCFLSLGTTRPADLIARRLLDLKHDVITLTNSPHSRSFDRSTRIGPTSITMPLSSPTAKPSC